MYLWETAVDDVEQTDGVVLESCEGLEDEGALLPEQGQGGHCLTEEELCH